MSIFIKYLMWGLLGLCFNLAFPSVPIDCWLLVIAAAFLCGGPLFSISLLAILAAFYGELSLLNPMQIFVPVLIGIFLFHYFRKFVPIHDSAEHILLIFFLYLAKFTFWTFSLGIEDTLVGLQEDVIRLVVTTITGVWAAPAIIENTSAWMERFRPRVAFVLPWLNRHHKRTLAGRRKPFGFEDKI